MANDAQDRARHGVLGDIRPDPSTTASANEDKSRSREPEEQDKSMSGGSQHDRTEHSGSRDVTEGTTGGTGAETGGTRNYRQGTGATGTDIGNRPE
jgi:hypothetical protein